MIGRIEDSIRVYTVATCAQKHKLTGADAHMHICTQSCRHRSTWAHEKTDKQGIARADEHQ